MTPLQSAQIFQDISEEEKETDRENLPEIDINQSGQIEHSTSRVDGPSMFAQSGQESARRNPQGFMQQTEEFSEKQITTGPKKLRARAGGFKDHEPQPEEVKQKELYTSAAFKS